MRGGVSAGEGRRGRSYERERVDDGPLAHARSYRHGIGAWILFLLLGTLVARAADDRLATRVIVLANSDDPDSLRVARHYAEMRGVPAVNVIALKLPPTESVSWREFIVTLWEPLLAELVRTKWIDAIPMIARDALGR